MAIRNLSDQYCNKKMEKNKDKLVVIIGASLVALVAVFTFVRPILTRKTVENKILPQESQSYKYSFISAPDLIEKIKSSKNLTLIDIRYADQFRQEHIMGSINVEPENFESYLEKIGKTSEIFILGSDSNDVNLKFASEALRNNGFENFSILSGGIKNWIETGGRTIRAGDPNFLSDQAKITIVKPEDLKKALDNKDSNLYILDLRVFDQYALEHLPQAKNIPGSELEAKFETIPIGKNIVYYADSELESFQLGVALFDLGLTRSSALEGGIKVWKEKGYPVEK